MQTTRSFRCAFNVISSLVVALVGAPLVALVVAPVVAMGQVLPARVAPTVARDSSRTLSESSYPLLSPYSFLPSYSDSSSSPFAGGISGRTARLTLPTALMGEIVKPPNAKYDPRGGHRPGGGSLHWRPDRRQGATVWRPRMRGAPARPTGRRYRRGAHWPGCWCRRWRDGERRSVSTESRRADAHWFKVVRSRVCCMTSR